MALFAKAQALVASGRTCDDIEKGAVQRADPNPAVVECAEHCCSNKSKQLVCIGSSHTMHSGAWLMHSFTPGKGNGGRGKSKMANDRKRATQKLQHLPLDK